MFYIIFVSNLFFKSCFYFSEKIKRKTSNQIHRNMQPSQCLYSFLSPLPICFSFPFRTIFHIILLHTSPKSSSFTPSYHIFIINTIITINSLPPSPPSNQYYPYHHQLINPSVLGVVSAWCPHACGGVSAALLRHAPRPAPLWHAAAHPAGGGVGGALIDRVGHGDTIIDEDVSTHPHSNTHHTP